MSVLFLSAAQETRQRTTADNPANDKTAKLPTKHPIPVAYTDLRNIFQRHLESWQYTDSCLL